VTVPKRFAEVGDPHAGIDDVAHDLTPLLEWAERDAANGEGDMPYPPDYPKMPGEPMRVQPSRARTARAVQQADLEARIRQQRAANLAAVSQDSGFGARTKAMWHLATSDFWGVGFFYAGIALLLVILDCAAIALKLASHGNAYERAEAREARRLEHEAVARHEHDLRIMRATADAYAEATLDVVTNGIRTAGQEQKLFDTATDQARARLAASVADDLDPDHLLLRS
jgi:hypothetical protein